MPCIRSQYKVVTSVKWPIRPLTGNYMSLQYMVWVTSPWVSYLLWYWCHGLGDYPQPRPSGDYVPLRLPLSWLGEHRHEHICPPYLYIGLTGSWCFDYYHIGIPLSSVSVIIPWVFKHRDVNMLVSSVSILRPWCDETVLYRHTVMSRFNQLTRLLITLCIQLLQTLYSFVREYVYYTFFYMCMYIYIYIYIYMCVCVNWL